MNTLRRPSAIRLACLTGAALLLACAGRRLFYVHSELARLNGDDFYTVAPGPWAHADVPLVYSDASHAPDELVISTLKALMALPGAKRRLPLASLLGLPRGS